MKTIKYKKRIALILALITLGTIKNFKRAESDSNNKVKNTLYSPKVVEISSKNITKKVRNGKDNLSIKWEIQKKNEGDEEKENIAKTETIEDSKLMIIEAKTVIPDSIVSKVNPKFNISKETLSNFVEETPITPDLSSEVVSTDKVNMEMDYYETTGNLIVTTASTPYLDVDKTTPTLNLHTITSSINNIFAMSTTNKETININEDHSYGMLAIDNSTATNEGTINVNGDRSYGMLTIDNSTVINKETININGDYSHGIFAKYNSIITNEGSINVNGDYSYGMYAIDNSTAINKETININGDRSYGMLATNSSTAINEGILTINGDISYGMFSIDNSTVTNEIGGVIKGNKNLSIGMYVIDNSTAINKGSITIDGDRSTGMYAIDSSILINTGTIDMNGSSSYGIYATYNSTTINEGTISTNEDNSYGILSSDSSTAINEGTIYVNGNRSYGICTAYNSMATNEGAIYVNGNSSYGMYSQLNSTATNEGTIYVNGDRSYGMYSKDDSTIINNGTIYVNGNSSYGMYARLNSTATNEGTIYINGDRSYGMYAIDNSTITNNGTIVVDPNSTGSSDIYADGTSTIVNNGTYSSDGSVTITTDDDSDFIMGTGDGEDHGTVSSGEEIVVEGDIVLGAHVAAGEYGDEYIVEDMLVGETIENEDGTEFGETETTSLLYDGEWVLVENEDGTKSLNGELERNDSTLSDYSDDEYSSLAETFGMAMDDEEYRDSLSDDFLSVVEGLFYYTGSVENINYGLDQIEPGEYGNISTRLSESYTRSMTNVNTMFDLGEKELYLLDTAKERKMGYAHENFRVFASSNTYDVLSPCSSSSSTTSNVGVKAGWDFTDNTGLYLGYEEGEYEFSNSSEENYKSYEIGIQDERKMGKFNLRSSFGYRYGNHEMNRGVYVGPLGTVESKYDSHVVGGEIKGSYDYRSSIVNMNPYIGLSTSLIYRSEIDEKLDASAYLDEQMTYSVKPKLGLNFWKEFNLSKDFKLIPAIGSELSFELGNVFTDVVGYELIGDNLDLEHELYEPGNLNGGTERERLGVYVGFEVRYKEDLDVKIFYRNDSIDMETLDQSIGGEIRYRF